MKKKYFLLLYLSLIFSSLNAQLQLSAYSEVSIITAAKGDELYSTFGHSAIRVKDPVLNLDLIYNYGMFDFNAPNFYSNFTKGKLLYQLGRYEFKYFLPSYKKDKRWVKQQVLNLTQSQKQAFFNFLEKNALPENANYFYDPFYNNCATKLRDITSTILGKKVFFANNNLEEKLSFRQLMNREMSWNTWGSFGINFALGSKLDTKASTLEYMYLPKYVFSIFKSSNVLLKNKKKNLVIREDILLDFDEVKSNNLIFSPFLVFSLITILGLFLTYKDFKKKQRSKYLDFLLFFISGILGTVILFLWFFTNHSTTPNNFNFLWAFAPNTLIAFLLFKKQIKNWVSNYIKLLLLFLGIIPILWLTGIQLFPLSIIPLLILCFLRYLFLIKYLLPFKK